MTKIFGLHSQQSVSFNSDKKQIDDNKSSQHEQIRNDSEVCGKEGADALRSLALAKTGSHVAKSAEKLNDRKSADNATTEIYEDMTTEIYEDMTTDLDVESDPHSN